jgi:tRNA threonylcarbamoyladenosine biosynthesis protein TsaB
MTVLALDTATAATTVALCDSPSGLVLSARDDPAPGARPGHATRLLPLIDELLERFAAAAGTREPWKAVDLIAAGVGPGTFTGLRIGIATAGGLARARAIRLAGISTLRSLALNSELEPTQSQPDAVLAILDARRGEVFAAGWPPGQIERGDPLLGPAALTPHELAEQAAGLGHAVLGIGDGAVEFRLILERSGVSIPHDDSLLHRVTAVNHCRLAGQVQPSDPGQLQPEYLRLPDAEITRRARTSR